MYNYKLTIQYDGGRYKGWQRLGSDDNTIQAKLEQVLSQQVGKDLEIIGCSRTDAGVHALSQIANFKTNDYLKEGDIKEYVNRYLPSDISVTEVVMVGENFHARYNAKDKTYLYKIWNKDFSNPFIRKYSQHVKEKLNISLMKAAAVQLLGTHDFTAFSNAKSKKKSMVREIYSIDIEELDGLINIRICGNSFLYNMARWIVGALIEAGLGRLMVEEIPIILEARERGRAGNLADACGLYLEKINY
jgi:tRNA pseudouridine38-40 synthase